MGKSGQPVRNWNALLNSQKTDKVDKLKRKQYREEARVQLRDEYRGQEEDLLEREKRIEMEVAKDRQRKVSMRKRAREVDDKERRIQASEVEVGRREAELLRREAELTNRAVDLGNQEGEVAMRSMTAELMDTMNKREAAVELAEKELARKVREQEELVDRNNEAAEERCQKMISREEALAYCEHNFKIMETKLAEK